MIFVVPIVLGTIALTCAVLSTVESPHLQGLTTAAFGSIGVTAYATRALIDRLHRTNSRRTPLTHVLSRHFNHLAATTLPRISRVLNELAPYSGPLSSVAVDTLSSSPALAPYVNQVGAWLGPRKPTFDFNLFFEWQPIHEDDGSIYCGSDDAYYLSLTGLCYRMPSRASLVRSLDLYRDHMKALAVYGQMLRMPVCMPGDFSSLQRSNIRSVLIFGRASLTITSTNQVISVHPILPTALAHSASGAAVSLDVYRPEMKSLAVYGQATPLRRCIYTELLRTLSRSLAALTVIYRRGIAILTDLRPSRVKLIFACTLALIGVCTQVIRILRCYGPTDAKTVESSALVPNQRPYILVLDDNQPKEPKWWSLVPRFPLEDLYGQYDRDQGPEDDVSQVPTSDSHGASMDLVASNHQAGFVTTSASSASDLDLTISTGPEVWIPSSHSDDCGGQLSGYSASSTTFFSCDDTIPVDSPAADTSSPILTGSDLCGTVEPQPTTETATADNQDVAGALEEPSIQDTTGHVGAGTDGCLDELRMLPGNQVRDMIPGTSPLLTRNEQPLDASTVDELLAADSNVDVDASADMSLSSEDLVGLSDVKQESLADELARMDPTEDGDVDSGLAISPDEPTHSDLSNADAPTLENNLAGLADGFQGNVSLDAWVDMSLETDAGNEDTPLDTPQTNEDEAGISAGDEVGHTSTTPNSSGLLLLSNVGSSEPITNERADAFFADMTTDPFISSREGLSTIIEEDSAHITPTAAGLPTEQSLDPTTDGSLGIRLPDIELAALGDSAHSLDSALDGSAAPKVEYRDWANASHDLEIPEPRYGAPLCASVHAPGPARLASALVTVTEENLPEDQPDHLQTTGTETSGGEEHPMPGPGGLTGLRVPSKSYNAALSGLAHLPIMASPSLPLFASPSPHASSLLVPSTSYIAMSRDQDESVQEIGRLPGGSSASMWAPVGEDTTSEDAAGQGATVQDAPGQDAAGEGVGETAGPKKTNRRVPSKANLRGKKRKGEARKADKNLPFSERK
ncbi:hypothetical protein FRC09_019551 [Ceratobasidium sp. 395]|nr:hypothetical protein FRC09_019551 [Ceratobasidium sp. 395]